MSIYKDLGMTYARNAGADLSAKQSYLAKIASDGDLELASAATDSVIGVVTEGAVADKPATVQFGGIAKVICGGSITAGNRLTSDGDGKAVATSSAGNRVFGIALESGSANEIIPVLLKDEHIATS
jgi:hypothetical protein